MRKLLKFGLPFISIFAIPPLARAADIGTGWGEWWLPPNHSAHGGDIDLLFNWIFWITMVAFIAVEVVLVVFLIKYRHRKDRKKAVFTHGNTRLEMAWTVAPAIILAVLALSSKKVWDNFRYAPSSNDPGRAQVLVVGQQFKWNFVYPGPDGKLGKYLIWPKITDEHWSDPRPANNADKLAHKPYEYPPGSGWRGPADAPPDQVVAAIKSYIDNVNSMGKVFEDPDGADDIGWERKAGEGELILPKDRPIEIQLSAKDVIHDFFLPNFRVKLDAVPGMRGHIYFTALMSTKEREAATIKTYTIDELMTAAQSPANNDLTAIIDETDKEQHATQDRRSHQWLYKDDDGTVLRNNGTIVDPEGDRTATIKRLKTLGVTHVKAFLPGTWELVCEELCGYGHTTMKGIVRIVDSDEYDTMKLDQPYHRPGPRWPPRSRNKDSV